MSSGLFRIGVVLSPRDWSGRLHAYIADHVPGVELTMVRDQQAAVEASPHVLLIDDSTPWFTTSFVERAGRLGIRLVGVYDRNDGGIGRQRLADLGLTHLLEEAMPPDDVVFLLDRLRPIIADDQPAHLRQDAAAKVAAESGIVVAVGGPSGSGARELAGGAACRLGRLLRGVRCSSPVQLPGMAERSVDASAVSSLVLASDASHAGLTTSFASRRSGICPPV